MAPAWVRSGGVPWRRVGDGLVLLPPGETEPITVSGSGLMLWELLAAPISVPDVSQRLAEHYGVSPEVVADAIEPVIANLARLGAVRVAR